MVQNLKAVVIEKVKIADNTFKLKLKPINTQKFIFIPGQFISIEVAPKIRRSYSIASLPGEDFIELIADAVRNGPGSKFFLNSKAGDEVDFVGPFGNLIYKKTEKKALFLATGTGVVPIISLIEYILEILKIKQEVTLYLGFRFIEDIFYKDFFEDLEKKFSNFKFYITLSKPDDKWKGLKGRITEYYEKYLETNKDCDIYVCGGREVVKLINENLLRIGIEKDSIFYENF